MHKKPDMKNCNRTRRTSSPWLADSPVCNTKPPNSSSGVESPSYEMRDDEHQSSMMLGAFHIINMPDEDERFQEDIDHNVPRFEDRSEMISEPLDLSMKRKNLLSAATEHRFTNNLVRWTGSPVTDDRNIPPECPNVMTAWSRVLYDEINRASDETTYTDLHSRITNQSETIQSNYYQESSPSETNQSNYNHEFSPFETNQSTYNQESSPSETNQSNYNQESIPSWLPIVKQEPIIKTEPEMCGYYFFTEPMIDTLDIKVEPDSSSTGEPMIDPQGIKVEPDSISTGEPMIDPQCIKVENVSPGEAAGKYYAAGANTMTGGCVQVKSEMEEEFCDCPEDQPCCEEHALHGPEASHDIVSDDTATDGTATNDTASDTTDDTTSIITTDDTTSIITTDDTASKDVAGDDISSNVTTTHGSSTDNTTTNDTVTDDTVTIDTVIGGIGNISFDEVTDDTTANDNTGIFDTAINDIDIALDEVTDDIANNNTDTIDDTDDTAANETATTVSFKIPPVPGDFEDTIPYGWPSDQPETVQVPKIVLKIPKKKKYTKKLVIVKGCDKCKSGEDPDLDIDDADADDLPDNPFITCPICDFFFSLEIFKMHYLEHWCREDHPEFSGHRERLNVCKLCGSITVLGKRSKKRKREEPKDSQTNQSVQTEGDHSEINNNTKEDREEVPELKKRRTDTNEAVQEVYTTEVAQDKHAEKEHMSRTVQAHVDPDNPESDAKSVSNCFRCKQSFKSKRQWRKHTLMHFQNRYITKLHVIKCSKCKPQKISPRLISCPSQGCGMSFSVPSMLRVYRKHFLEHRLTADHPDFNGPCEKFNICKCCGSIKPKKKKSKKKRLIQGTKHHKTGKARSLMLEIRGNNNTTTTNTTNTNTTTTNNNKNSNTNFSNNHSKPIKSRSAMVEISNNKNHQKNDNYINTQSKTNCGGKSSETKIKPKPQKNKTFKCLKTDCPMTYLTKNELKKHLISFHLISSGKYYIEVFNRCGRLTCKDSLDQKISPVTFSTIAEDRILPELKKSQIAYACNLCGQFFEDRTCLNLGQSFWTGAILE